MSRSSYLQSTAMAAVMATGAFSGVAQAADAVVEPPAYEPPAAQYYFSVEGSVVFAKPSVDKVGYDPDNDVGLYAGVAFGRKITPAWDWRVGLAFTNFEDNDSDGDFDDETLTSELRFATADLEAGFAAVENTSTNLRFFGGLRVLWEDDSAEAALFDGFDRQDSDFLGIGPRIGADFQSRFGDSRFGMSGMVAGAAIWGNRDVDRNFNNEFGDSFDENDEVYNLEGNLGIDYHWSDTSKFTLGYRAQQWWGLRQAHDESDMDIDEDVLVHGPFLKYVAQF